MEATESLSPEGPESLSIEVTGLLSITFTGRLFKEVTKRLFGYVTGRLGSNKVTWLLSINVNGRLFIKVMEGLFFSVTGRLSTEHTGRLSNTIHRGLETDAYPSRLPDASTSRLQDAYPSRLLDVNASRLSHAYPSRLQVSIEFTGRLCMHRGYRTPIKKVTGTPIQQGNRMPFQLLTFRAVDFPDHTTPSWPKIVTNSFYGFLCSCYVIMSSLHWSWVPYF